MDKALQWLREKGLAGAVKKASRTTGAGCRCLVHSSRVDSSASWLRCNCETDFVARLDEFQALAHDMAMQVAASQARVGDAGRCAGRHHRARARHLPHAGRGRGQAAQGCRQHRRGPPQEVLRRVLPDGAAVHQEPRSGDQGPGRRRRFSKTGENIRSAALFASNWANSSDRKDTENTGDEPRCSLYLCQSHCLDGQTPSEGADARAQVQAYHAQAWGRSALR